MIFAFSRLEIVILIAASSYFITLISLPIPLKIGMKLKLFDKPSARKQQKKRLVRIGGISLILGFILSIFFINSITNLSLISIDNTVNIIFTALIIFFIGLIDDLYSISPLIRLFFQILISIFLWSKGLKIDKIDIAWLQITEIYFSNLFSLIFTSFWIVGITNAINWLDGLDGLACGVVGFAAIGLSTISFQNGQIIEPILGAALLGCSFGFLRYNFFPAKLLMGDGGSNFLGFLLATISLKSITSIVNPIGLFVPLFLLSLPIIDMAFVIYRRLRKGQSPFTADREHIHHRLINSGLTEIGTVLYIYGISQWITVLTISLASLNNAIYIIFFMFSSILLFLSTFLTKFINF